MADFSVFYHRERKKAMASAYCILNGNMINCAAVIKYEK